MLAIYELFVVALLYAFEYNAFTFVKFIFINIKKRFTVWNFKKSDFIYHVNIKSGVYILLKYDISCICLLPDYLCVDIHLIELLTDNFDINLWYDIYSVSSDKKLISGAVQMCINSILNDSSLLTRCVKYNSDLIDNITFD